MISLSLTESQTFRALGDFLTTILPASCKILKGQQNRIAEPIGADFVTMTPILRERIETNTAGYQDTLFTASITGTSMVVTAMQYGALAVGSLIFGVGVAAGTVVTAGSGGVGTYAIDPPQTIGSEPMAAGQQTLLHPTKVTMQLDVHGPSSADNAQIIATLFRSGYAVDLFLASGFDVTPLYAGEPRQLPFANGEQQVEFRWSIDAVMQCNPVVTIPQQFADALEINLINVDVVYPPA